ncbi:putative nucleoside-diphosphate-sugar epimerase [Spongiibacter sp. IMCC21906]|uniref:mitochondrial fission ELM1 family protein n=1 Tax=Spongiibacter sp. IMCC21906 TaxID=1620392 RepID=UPI00062DFE82|nr:ELM1/GtrOC1 family putative glycosyltransferase [Spongiibacter sp. IMCC21906]AKH68643.1 putative nucleoside-diphosphate-sugar epimerase [Spongiibacter sp. IMCC21906]
MKPLRCWIFTEGRLGHLNQVRGLAQRLSAKTETAFHYLDLSQQRFRYSGKQGLLDQFAAEQFPDWIIGAGSNCHRPMIWTRFITGCPSVVLSSPSWPLCLFDAACIPAHDEPPHRKNILLTQGVLNTMVPVVEGRNPSTGLILLGGINKHFEWDDARIAAQVRAVVEASPDISWTISNSPRSPASLMPSLGTVLKHARNVELLSYEQTHKDWLKTQLSQVGRVWVSCDSVSMVFECITSATPTGLLKLQPLGDSRVTRSMAQVEAKGLVRVWNERDKGTMPSADIKIWEADRAADWLIEQTLQKKRS